MERTTNEPTALKKAKTSLLALAIVLTMVLAAAAPAFAQQGSVTATGVLEGPFTQGPDPEPTYRLTDEATGTTYVLVSGFVELGPFVGQRVTIEGARIGGAEDAPPALNVTQIEPAGGQTASPTATATATATPTATAAAAGQDQYGSASALPATGGAWPGSASLIALSAGALLVAGGLLARRIIR